MIHPHTRLAPVDDHIGLGVFATRRIPRGTLVYVADAFEIRLTPGAYEALDAVHRAVADRYSFVDRHGVRIISWDAAKYVNHHCEPNTISTGYGFEMALRDIEAGEQITDEYGLFNMSGAIECACGSPRCRGVVRADDADALHGAWDARIRAALPDLPRVAQPLWDLLDAETRRDVEAHLAGRAPYRSVRLLKWAPAHETAEG